jgi:hypothetical protein
LRRDPRTSICSPAAAIIELSTVTLGIASVAGRLLTRNRIHLPEREGDQLFELIVTIDDRRPALDSGTADQTQTIRELTGSVAGS